MNQKGLSELISIVLIIGLVVALATLVFYWSSNLISKSTSEADITLRKTINCFRDIELVITDVCYDNKTYISLENRKDGSINGEFLLIRIEGSKDSLIQPTPPGTNILPFEKKRIELTYFPEVGLINKISIIPRLMTDKGPIFCTSNIAESSNVRQGC